jgi:indole-3-acetate monooxygenase
MNHATRTLDQLPAAEALPATDPAPRLHAEIRRLAPAIAARAAEIEAARRIPPDLVTTLRSVGVFRLLAPRSHGGFEFDLPTALDVLRALARIDGAVGWCAMIANGASLFASLLPRHTYDAMCENGPVIVAGSTQPGGTVEKAPGGWRVKGRWPFVSGCQHADWIGGLCVVSAEGKPLPGPQGEAGPPLMRGFFLPARKWQIEDTWHVAGLKGTGSHHVALNDVVVPAENFFDFPDASPCLPGTLYQSALQFPPLLHAATSVGMAEGALAALVDLANTGRQQFRATAPMRLSETFQGELGRLAAELRAAQAYLQTQAAHVWRLACAGALNDEAFLTQSTQATIWIVHACVRVADGCFTLGGGAALYETSPLQRRLRDLHTAAQHAMAHQRHYVGVGEMILDSACGTAKTAA